MCLFFFASVEAQVSQLFCSVVQTGFSYSSQLCTSIMWHQLNGMSKQRTFVGVEHEGTAGQMTS